MSYLAIRTAQCISAEWFANGINQEGDQDTWAANDQESKPSGSDCAEEGNLHRGQSSYGTDHRSSHN
jgi:hypothetical protein